MQRIVAIYRNNHWLTILFSMFDLSSHCGMTLHIVLWFGTKLVTSGNFVVQYEEVRLCFRRCLYVCLFVSKFAGKLPNGFAWKFQGGLANEQMIKLWWRSGSPSGYRDVFRIRHYWEIRKVVSTDCAAWGCRAGHALAGIAIATMTSLRHRPLAEVCTVPVLLVLFCYVQKMSVYVS